jgi:hypothetical protein
MKGGITMRAFGQRLLTSTAFCLAALLAGRVFAQAAEAPEEITVEGGKTLGEYRLELERARDEVFRRFNEANEGSGTDVTCKDEQPTGSRMRQNVCRSEAENRGDAAAARGFLNALIRNAGNYITGQMDSRPPVSLVNAEIGTGVAQADGQVGEADALAKFEQEWMRLLSQDQDFYRAVVEYVELERQYDSVRGVNDPTAAALVVPGVAVTAGQPSGPQCEATTLTEYQQRNNVARVTGTVSLAACPAGTTGTFTLVARVRDESGESRTIEFPETWQRDDSEDHTFNTDYPIGDNVELMSVRVRNLKCTCAPAAQ